MKANTYIDGWNDIYLTDHSTLNLEILLHTNMFTQHCCSHNIVGDSRLSMFPGNVTKLT